VARPPLLHPDLGSNPAEMATSKGYAVITRAVPIDLAQQAAEEISKGVLKIKSKRPKYTEFEAPSICFRIRDEFMENGDRKPVEELLEHSILPSSKHINVGTFHESTPDPNTSMTAGKGQVYLTIALTDLGTVNGWFIFLEGSHKRDPSPPFSIAQWKQVSLNVDAGDAVVWRGDLIYLHSPGGGASFMTVVFD